MQTTRNITKIIVHCSDTENGTVESIRKFHTAPPPDGRGWKDIGYHSVIYRDGSIHDGRQESEIGAHCYGHNSTSLGVCLIGKADFTDAQYTSLITLLREWALRYNLNLQSDVFCHYELDQHGKTCPNIKKEHLLKLLSIQSFS